VRRGASIDQGLLVLVGIAADTQASADKLLNVCSKYGYQMTPEGRDELLWCRTFRRLLLLSQSPWLPTPAEGPAPGFSTCARTGRMPTTLCLSCWRRLNAPIRLWPGGREFGADIAGIYPMMGQ